MPEPRPLAALTASLLARKGQARPAVRPAFMPRAVPEPVPTVVQQQARLASLYSPVEHELYAPPERELGERRIALTLRLDDARHLQLKLLAARRRTSAQALLVDALDETLREATNDGCVCGLTDD